MSRAPPPCVRSEATLDGVRERLLDVHGRRRTSRVEDHSTGRVKFVSFMRVVLTLFKFLFSGTTEGHSFG